ncbi:SpvB/TcaC N-terminal domain-containing protein, partial [Hoeflea sp. TYP-13]|uniref:SpvB/TcaC N-terminal domain-containing protein n=1 Tax=Hoeflea sp. TYP-13 TaxID=3230023 RepID=UPI0034C6BC0F
MFGSHQAQAQVGDASDTVKIPTGEFPTASGRGNASYEYGLDLPGFRGLEPAIGLQYDSSRKTKRGGRYQGWLGYGWGIDGFDVIERVSEGRGLAYYDDAKDVFLLNGYELVECVAGTVSPSCDNGGTHATQIESYQRIKFSSGTNSWEITGRDGTRTVLSSAGSFGGTVEHANSANKFRWLISSITDTDGNQVSFTYACDTLPACYPQTITYNGTEVRFYLETRPDMIIMANGQTLTRYEKRIRSITTTVGGSMRSAVALTYDEDAYSGASRLTTITRYGTDAVVAADGAVTAGSARPPVTMTYYDVNTSRTTVNKPINGIAAFSNLLATDLDHDGFDEVQSVAIGSSCSPWDSCIPAYGANLYVFDNSGDPNASIQAYSSGFTTIHASHGLNLSAFQRSGAFVTPEENGVMLGLQAPVTYDTGPSTSETVVQTHIGSLLSYSRSGGFKSLCSNGSYSATCAMHSSSQNNRVSVYSTDRDGDMVSDLVFAESSNHEQGSADFRGNGEERNYTFD